MNREIVKRFSEVMDWEDELYILGDCFLNDNDQGMRLMRQIPGHKHIIWGNHDSDTRKSLMEAAGYDCLGYATIRKINGFQFYMIDGFIVSGNVHADGIETLDQGFVSSDHNPDRLRFTLEGDAV